MNCYRFADHVVELRYRYPFIGVLLRDFACDDEPEFTVSATKADIEAERGSSGQPAAYCEFACIYRKLCLELTIRGCFLMHSAMLELGGVAYAFLGKSGAGKSTHMRLWLSRFRSDAHVINGDKPIIRMEQNDAGGSRFMAYGTPWSGKEGLYSNAHAPLGAMCFIEQAPSCSIVKLSSDETTTRLMHQLLIPRDSVGVVKLMSMVGSLIDSVPAYLLRCDISDRAVQLSYSAMVKGIILP